MMNRIVLGLFFIVAVFSVTVTAQNTLGGYRDLQAKMESDSLFASGVTLFNQGDFARAVSIFHKCSRIDLDQLPESSPRRTYAAIWEAHCYKNLGYEDKAALIFPDFKYYPPLDRRLTIETDSLSALGLQFYDDAAYEDALSCFLRCAELEKSIVGESSIYYSNTLSYCASCYIYLHQFQEAVDCLHIMAEIQKNVFGAVNPDYLNVLNDLAECYASLGNYSEALRLGSEALEFQKNSSETDQQDYAVSLSNLATYNSSMGNYSEAVRLGSEAMEIIKNLLGTEHPYYATALTNLASYYSSLRNYTEAIRLGTEALEIRKIIFGSQHPDYAISLNNLATYNSLLGNYNEAIRFGTEAIEILKKTLGTEHPYYATSLSNLAESFSSLGNYTEAIRLETEAMEIQKLTLGPEHPDYATSLNNLATYNSLLGNYNEAIRFGTEALEIQKLTLGSQHPDYATSLNNLAESFSSLGNYTEAIRLGTEALEIRKNIFGSQHPEYALSLNNLATYNSSLGNYTEAIRLESEALEIQKISLGPQHHDYAVSLSNLADCYSALGNFPEAVRLGSEALAISKNIFGSQHPEYATLLNNLACYNSLSDNFSEAVRLGSEALEIQKLILGPGHPAYATSLNNLSIYNSSLGNFSEAIRLESEALEIQKLTLGPEHPDYALSLNNLASYNSALGNYSEAVRLGNEAIDIFKKSLGTMNIHYFRSLNNLIFNLFADRDFDNAKKFCLEYNPLLSDYILNTFQDLSSNQRTKFWNLHKWWFQQILPIINYNLKQNDLCETTLDATLLSKGLLLNADTEMSKLIKETNDDVLINLYTEIQALGFKIEKLAMTPIAERPFDIDSLRSLKSKLERHLLSSCKVYGDYTANLKINWHNVQSKLNDNDVAIEMISFPVVDGSVIYYAFVFDNNAQFPLQLELFKEEDLDQFKNYAVDNSKYTLCNELGDLIWGKLMPYIKNAVNVYFSPAGELYNIPIESLVDEKYGSANFYRLSSTRELALLKDVTNISKSAVYGGIKYDAEIDGAPEVIKNSPKRNISPLPSTLNEALNLEAILKKSNIESSLLTGISATESSFKALNNRNFNFIHIGTHGFYWTETEALMSSSMMPFLMLEHDKSTYFIEDKALTRSGLLFAGARNMVKQATSAEDIDDGFLTAKEISRLDLRGLDLVVLSACQTGLGDVTGDGVFGLQRGFKKAGANSLMMSLWKVDDMATELLMNRFYDNLFLKNMCKYESLLDAQKYIREYGIEMEIDSNGSKQMFYPYQDSKYWAAFILLDALN